MFLELDVSSFIVGYLHIVGICRNQSQKPTFPSLPIEYCGCRLFLSAVYGVFIRYLEMIKTSLGVVEVRCFLIWIFNYSILIFQREDFLVMVCYSWD